MITRLFFFLFFSGLLSLPLSGQSVLDRYVQEALEQNIALQQEHISYQRSLAALEEAKANFWPELSIQARYSVAQGGRAFVIPVGDLVNPIYQNLNAINQLGQSTSPDYPTFPNYPNISNVEENFLRETEQETVLRLAMPVFNQAILANQRIRENLSEAQRISVEVYKRELVKEVRLAYYGYQQASEAVALLEDTRELVAEQLRTTKSLFANHQVTQDAVFSVEAQVGAVDMQLAEGVKQQQVAQAFFNFLLNRSYDAPIESEATDLPGLSAVSVAEMQRMARRQRGELEQFNYLLSVSDQKIKMEKDSYLPTLNLVADYGIQGTRYSLTRDDDFFLGSVVMSWKLFQPANRARVQQAKLDKMEVEQQKSALQKQIELQVVEAWYELRAVREKLTQAEASVKAARAAFRLIDKKYRLGQVNLLELQQARNQMTQAENQLIIVRYELLGVLAQLEYVTGSYPL